MIRTALAAALMLAAAAPAAAAPKLALYPVRIGAETARYYRGNPAIVLHTPDGVVEIRPLPVESGQVKLAIAVYNQGGHAANLGIENISAWVNGLFVPLPTHDQLVAEAQKKARNTKIGVAVFAGIAAGVASTASNHGTYYRHVMTPHGGYTQAIHWQDDTPGIIGATAAVAGGAIAIHGINNKLDYTLDRLDSQILETTTVDPGSSFGGVVVLPIAKGRAQPADIRLQIMFGGIAYPFAFRLSPAGVNVPPPLPATAEDAAMPYLPEQLPMPAGPAGATGPSGPAGMPSGQ